MSLSLNGLHELRRHSAGLAAFLLGLLGCPGSAGASDFAGGTLTVVRDTETADCPDETALGLATLALGTPPEAPAEGVNVSVVFQRDAFGYGALVTTTGAQGGVREVRKPGPTCAPLAEAVSVVLAVLFDLAPREGVAPPEPPPPAAPSPPPPAAEPPPRVEAPPPAPKPREVPRETGPELALGIGVHGGASYGLLGAAPVGAVSGAVRPSLGRWELALGALWAPNRAVDFIGRTVNVSILAGRLGACAWLFASRARLDVAPCAAVLLGRIRGDADGFDQNKPPVTNPWLALEAGASGRWSLTAKWALRLGISVIVPTGHHEFTVARAGTAFSSSRAAGLLEAGPELRFP